MEQIVINIIDTHSDFETVEKFTQSGAPVLSYSGGESRFSSIMSSKFTFDILNETAEDGKFLDLLTGEERRFLIELNEVVGPDSMQIVWRGFLLPDVYSEPYKNGSFFVAFTATDGLDILKTKPFLFYKTRSVIDYISKCLWETGLHQEIYFAPGIENAFYDWKTIQIFDECFTKYNENTDSYQYSSCYTVLEKLMKAVGATVFQHKGKWFVVGYNRKGNALDTYKVYSTFGSFLRNEQFIRNVAKPMFSEGLSVSMVSPYRTVQFNVTYQESEKAVDFSRFVKNDMLSSEEYISLSQQSAIASVSPFNNWRKNGATRVTAEPEDGGTYLKLSTEGNNTLHHPDEYPVFYTKAPYCVTMFKVYGPPHSFENDYIELKPENTVYVSPQVEGKELRLDIDMEFKIVSRANQQKYNEDFYRQAFRVDLLIGENVVFSTRSESGVYNSADTKITFDGAQKGPKYYWYVFPDYTTPIHVLDRFSIPASLKAEVQRKDLRSDEFGKLNVRVYIPRNGDNTFGFDDFHVSQVTVTKLDIKVKAWDDEQFILNREIRYTTKYENDLSFGDGKNDLYQNLFKINDRNDYPAYANEIVLFSGMPTQDNLYYYFLVNPLYADYINTRFYSLKLFKGASSVLACNVFGKLAVESGIELSGPHLRISKARIDEFPAVRDLLNGITKITVAGLVFFGNGLFLWQTVDRDKYINWKRQYSNTTERYLECYAKMIHECTAKTGVNLEGTAMSVVTPMDIVNFYFMAQEKAFVPTSVNIDFSSGKTRLTLTEAINQNVNDYANA